MCLKSEAQFETKERGHTHAHKARTPKRLHPKSPASQILLHIGSTSFILCILKRYSQHLRILTYATGVNSYPCPDREPYEIRLFVRLAMFPIKCLHSGRCFVMHATQTPTKFVVLGRQSATFETSPFPVLYSGGVLAVLGKRSLAVLHARVHFLIRKPPSTHKTKKQNAWPSK